MFNKAKLNFVVDAAIAAGFLVVAVSGFVLMFALPHGGYQGGRNALYAQQFILDRTTWVALHDWSAIVITAGVVGHVVLHWRWITCMARNLWRAATQPKAAPAASQAECPTA